MLNIYKNIGGEDKLDSIFLFLITLFIVFGIAFAISPLFSMLPIYQKKKQIQIDDSIHENLEKLRESASVEEKAESFIALMKLSYVSIHIMGNQGRKYNDKKQMEHFKKSLTIQAVEKLKMLGEQ